MTPDTFFSATHAAWQRGLVAVLACLLLAAGCSPADIDRTYGKRRGSQGGASVNGTAVLAGMFEAAGHRVITWRRLSPKLDQCDVIVWFPDSFPPPSEDQRAFLEDWVGNKPDRTLVYVGRDYDAAITYWRKVQPLAPPEQTMEVARRLATVQAEFDAARAVLPQEESCDWFVVRNAAGRQPVRSVSGPWSTGIDGSQLELELGARFDIPNAKAVRAWAERLGPVENRWHRTQRRRAARSQPAARGSRVVEDRELLPESSDAEALVEEHDASDARDTRPQFERLLTSQDATLVSRVTRPEWAGSQILVATNGSFLLNLPLVNHQHRVLAGKLIAACGDSGKRVAFLESGPAGPPILDVEPDAKSPTGFEVLTVWPIGVVALHFIILGITACFALLPIFGRASQLEEDSTSDFGKHVDALGELLARTADHQYAAGRVREYQAHLRREANASSSQ